ncbi:arylsulfatase [Arenibacter palladensis]|uniref:arylsulfatase n=1 Tax=Arenibacter palladensis TaxID=237373 RepID=UPI002FD4C894
MKQTSKQQIYIVIIFISLVILCSCGKGKSEKDTGHQLVKDGRPNIILIMSDDMGYSDIAPYGGEIETPNLTELAKGGLKFTQFYNTARCCPTRASLMTGCYPQQAGIGHMTNPSENPDGHNLGISEYQGFLSRNTVTIAEVLKAAGYNTLMTGKWHLGFEKEEQWPLQRGFEKYYGIVDGASNFFQPTYPRGIFVGNDTITINDENFYTTDAFTDNAIQFINDSKKEEPNSPFFLYLAYNAPHWPLQAPKKDIDKYRGKYMAGWEKLRSERFERMREMGLIDASWKLSTEDDIVEWDSLSEDKKKEMDLRMAIYAGMIDRMDQNIGRLVADLKAKNLYNNTIIMFLNDNGACAEGGMLGGGPASQLETKEGYFLSYGKAWANASNTPYKEYKHWLHEGGIASPFIVHWPEGIDKNRQGSIVREYGFLPDIMATCLNLAGADYPKEFNGNKITPMSGKSLKPLITEGETRIHTEPIFWEHEGNKAVRIGKYKLVQMWEQNIDDNWELYDLENDRTEMHNLIKQMPERAKEMIALYYDWADKMGVLPWNEVRQIMQKKKEEKH